MAPVFDPEMEAQYSAWYRSRQGRAVDQALEEMFKLLLEPRRGQRVLDVGCGTGNHLLILSRLGLDVSGVDASAHMIAKAKERLGHRCSLKMAMAEDLPFEDNEFDIVLLINTLEFVDDPLAVLMEAGRVALEKVFVGVINSFSWGAFKNRFTRSKGEALFSRARFFTFWDIKALVQKAYGPVPIRWRCVSPYPPVLEKIFLPQHSFWNGQRAPLGLFLGVCCPMLYTVRTSDLMLKTKIDTTPEPAGQLPLGAASTTLGQEKGGAELYERGLPL